MDAGEEKTRQGKKTVTEISSHIYKLTHTDTHTPTHPERPVATHTHRREREGSIELCVISLAISDPS